MKYLYPSQQNGHFHIPLKIHSTGLSTLLFIEYMNEYLDLCEINNFYWTIYP